MNFYIQCATFNIQWSDSIFSMNRCNIKIIWPSISLYSAFSFPVNTNIIAQGLFFSRRIFFISILFFLTASRIWRLSRLRSTARLKFFFGTLTVNWNGDLSIFSVWTHTMRTGGAAMALPSLKSNAMVFLLRSRSDFGSVCDNVLRNRNFQSASKVTAQEN